MSRTGRADAREPVRIDDSIAAQFAAMGHAVAVTAPKSDKVFEVMPSNWASLTTFLACETQWRSAATMAAIVWLGLDYVAVDVVMRRHGQPDSVFADLQVMEAEALDVFAEAAG